MKFKIPKITLSESTKTVLFLTGMFVVVGFLLYLVFADSVYEKYQPVIENMSVDESQIEQTTLLSKILPLYKVEENFTINTHNENVLCVPDISTNDRYKNVVFGVLKILTDEKFYKDLVSPSQPQYKIFKEDKTEGTIEDAITDTVGIFKRYLIIANDLESKYSVNANWVHFVSELCLKTKFSYPIFTNIFVYMDFVNDANLTRISTIYTISIMVLTELLLKLTGTITFDTYIFYYDPKSNLLYADWDKVKNEDVLKNIKTRVLFGTKQMDMKTGITPLSFAETTIPVVKSQSSKIVKEIELGIVPPFLAKFSDETYVDKVQNVTYLDMFNQDKTKSSCLKK